jgi:hypothetical protein
LGVLFYYISQRFLPFDSCDTKKIQQLVLKGYYEINNSDPLFKSMIRQMMNKDPKKDLPLLNSYLILYLRTLTNKIGRNYHQKQK